MDKLYYRIIQNFDVISFDIFDTLLIRAVNEPEDVFLLTAYNCPEIISDPQTFVRERKSAVRTAGSIFPNGEPGIDDIYRVLNSYSDSEKALLKKQELFIESQVLHPNPKITDFYRICTEAGKKIIAVSDMYLPESFLIQLLHKKGYEAVEKVYVSCEVKASKREGSLFRSVEQKLDIPSKNILHIGDSWKSDFVNPLKNGWGAYHSPKAVKTPGNLPDVLIRKTSLYYRGEYFYRLGFSVLGPILFGFIHWLNDRLLENNISTVLFFSRDGKIMKAAFDLLFPNSSIRTEYFHISRRAINAVAIKDHCNFDELPGHVEETYTCTVETFLKRIGLYGQDIEIPDWIDIHREYLTSAFWSDDQIRNFYEQHVKELLLHYSRQQHEYFLSYFKNNIDSGNLAVVDIGWRGSMQTRLEEIVHTMEYLPTEKIFGYYLGIESESGNRLGYLYKGLTQNDRKTIIDAGVGLFETLFLAREGTTIGYQLDDRIVTPVLDSYEISDEKLIGHLRNIHEGALAFVAEMGTYRIFDKVDPATDICLHPFSELCMNPSSSDMDHLEEIKFNDTENKPLINKKGLNYYLAHPLKFKSDYHNAPWKIGFLKENISVHFNWAYLYKAVKKRRG